jgi:hypothetical protein
MATGKYAPNAPKMSALKENRHSEQLVWLGVDLWEGAGFSAA